VVGIEVARLRPRERERDRCVVLERSSARGEWDRTSAAQPFTASGIDLDLTVTAHDTGTCIRYGTQATPNRYFRCFGTTTSRGSAIYDPCFAGPLGTAGPLVCPSTPTSSDVIEFAVTSVTSDQPSPMQRFPWAMQLVTGQVCLKVNAA
jgi:hypothetical protein